MKRVNELKTEQEVREIAEEIIGEGKECEKNLLTAVILFLLAYNPETEHDFVHVTQLALATKLPKGPRNPQSDLDKIFEQIAAVDPMSRAMCYYNAYKCYPDGMQGQAAGNIVYKIAPFVEEEVREYERQRKEVKYSMEDVEKMLEERLEKIKKLEEAKQTSVVDMVKGVKSIRTSTKNNSEGFTFEKE